MKKEWVEPRIEVQKFTPNEYVAACGDSGVNYLFKCDAGDGEWGDVNITIFSIETNGRFIGKAHDDARNRRRSHH